MGVGAETVGGFHSVGEVLVHAAEHDPLVDDDSHHPLALLGMPVDVAGHVLMVGVLLAGVVSSARTFSMNT